MGQTCAVVLAAGNGKRMKSRDSKVLCEVLFKPMLSWVLDHCAEAGLESVCVVVSENSEKVRAIVPPHCQFAVQSEQRGTGHAVRMASDFLRQHPGEDVIVLYGDAPFVDAQTIRASLEAHRAAGNAVTVVAARVEDPTGYGRIVTDETGAFSAIVEHRDADEATLAIHEVNSGIYWFRQEFLLRALEQLTDNNSQGEYYLTDTIAAARKMGESAGVFVAPNADSILGANDRKGLAKLGRIARDRVLDRLLENGVDIPLDDGVIISPDAVIGADTRILPGTIIKGRTIVGSGCVLGPGTVIEDSIIGDNVLLDSSHVENSRVDSGCRIGPFVHLRPGCHLHKTVKVGNFVELKNSEVGDRTSVAHLTYLGDSDVGDGVNVGCGVVTANYDGAQKFRTTIGDGCFIGCNTNLIAPVALGDGVITAAGTTVTEDVPGQALCIGRVRQEVREDWAAKNGRYKKR